jgi:hypothetical protein
MDMRYFLCRAQLADLQSRLVTHDRREEQEELGPREVLGKPDPHASANPKLVRSKQRNILSIIATDSKSLVKIKSAIT